MIRLEKNLVDKFIRLTRKYFATSDISYLTARYEAKEFLKRSSSWQVVLLLSSLARYTEKYDDIYRALEVFGITVEDKENENEIR